MDKPLSKLGVGPMSSEIVESVFRYSHRHGKPLMLIASKNQIDYKGGYVNNWTTKEYARYIAEMKKAYPNAAVYACRDHCGPGFNGEHDLNDVYKTIDADLNEGFDLIHIDFCHFSGSRKNMLQESRQAIEYILKRSPDTLIEVGTDENTGAYLDDVTRIRDEMNYFLDIVPVHFYVVQSGSLIKEINQVGGFHHVFLKEVKETADARHVYLKEHNADYLSKEEITKRKGLIGAVNVAPQYGVLQTQLTLQKCATYGIDASDFLNDVYQSGKWKKWLYRNDASNKYLCSVIAGHYVFANDPYKRLVAEINKHEDFKESVIGEMMKLTGLYLQNL